MARGQLNVSFKTIMHLDFEMKNSREMPSTKNIKKNGTNIANIFYYLHEEIEVAQNREKKEEMIKLKYMLYVCIILIQISNIVR